MNRAFRAMLVLSAVFHSTVAQSTAMYSSTASSTFVITGPVVVLEPIGTAKTEIGTGTAAFSGIQSPSGDLPATLAVSISGSASQPPNSLADSTYMSGHLFAIDNLEGVSTLIVPFTFSYEWTTAVSVDDGLHEIASASSFFHITGIDNEGLTIGGFSVPEYLVNPHYSTALSEIGGSGSDSVDGTIVVPAGILSEFNVITDTHGNATALVPAPTTISLLGLGLAGGLLGRRSPKGSLARPKGQL